MITGNIRSLGRGLGQQGVAIKPSTIELQRLIDYSNIKTRKPS